MRKRISLLIFALSLTAAAVWSPPAAATYPYCETHCSGWALPPGANCTCFGTRINTTCGQWPGVC